MWSDHAYLCSYRQLKTNYELGKNLYFEEFSSLERISVTSRSMLPWCVTENYWCRTRHAIFTGSSSFILGWFANIIKEGKLILSHILQNYSWNIKNVQVKPKVTEWAEFYLIYIL